MERAKIKISKQDRQGVRTPSDLELKYRFRKNFQDVSGVATKAQSASSAAYSTAQEASKLADGVMKDLETLFSHDITMTGSLKCSASTYIPPGDEEIETIKNHINQTAPIASVSLYDFNGDGIVDEADLILAEEYRRDLRPFSLCPAAIPTSIDITIQLSNPERLILFEGFNMWGRWIHKYVGINFTTVTNPDTEQRLSALEERMASLATNLGGE